MINKIVRLATLITRFNIVRAVMSSHTDSARERERKCVADKARVHAIKIVRASYIAFITEAPCRRGDTVIACCRRVRACVCGYACECSSAFRYTHMWNRIPHTLDFPVNYVLMHSSPAPTASMAAGSVCGGCFFLLLLCVCVLLLLPWWKEIYGTHTTQ